MDMGGMAGEPPGAPVCRKTDRPIHCPAQGKLIGSSAPDRFCRTTRAGFSRPTSSALTYGKFIGKDGLYDQRAEF